MIYGMFYGFWSKTLGLRRFKFKLYFAKCKYLASTMGIFTRQIIQIMVI